MPRRSRQSDLEQFLGDVYHVLKDAPAWAGPILILVALAITGFVSSLGPIGFIFGLLGLFVTAGIGIVWIAAEAHKWSNRQRLDRQTGIESIRRLSWQNFEELVAEAFRRKGYVVQRTGSAAGDRGIDLIAAGNGEQLVVQCKRWNVYKVGVKPIRELAGVVARDGATRGVLVTTGRLTASARTEAGEMGIEVIQADQLAAMINAVRSSRSNSPIPRLAGGGSECAATFSPPASTSAAPACPKCGTSMVRRTARRGAHAGSEFWGCPRYPACRGIVQMGD